MSTRRYTFNHLILIIRTVLHLTGYPMAFWRPNTLAVTFVSGRRGDLMRQESSGLLINRILLYNCSISFSIMILWKLNLQRRPELLRINHGLFIVVAYFRHHIVHLLLYLITIHQFCIWNSLSILLHVRNCVVLHGNRFIGIQFLCYTLIWFIICVHRLWGEATNYIGKILNCLLSLNQIRTFALLFLDAAWMLAYLINRSSLVGSLSYLWRWFNCKLDSTLFVNGALLTEYVI